MPQTGPEARRATQIEEAARHRDLSDEELAEYMALAQSSYDRLRRAAPALPQEPRTR